MSPDHPSFIGPLGLAARRLALYADECALYLKQGGYPGKAQSLEAKARAVMDALKPEALHAVEEQREGR